MDFESRRELRASVRSIVEGTIERLGYALIAVELSGDRAGPILRLCIDRPQGVGGGVGIRDCATVSRAISPELDVWDPLPNAYRLEVSSPGIERPVERPEDFERFIDFRARVRMGPASSRRRYKGMLKGVEDDHLRLAVGERILALPLAEIDRVRLDLEPEEYARLAEGLPAAPGGHPR